MPYFSGEQTDPDLHAAHRALERLNDTTQALLSEVMVEAIDLTTDQAKELARLCRAAARKIRRFRDEVK